MSDLAAFSAYLRRTNRARPQPDTVIVHPAGVVRSARSCQRALSAVFGFYDHHSQTPLSVALNRSRQQRQHTRQHASRTRRHPLGVKVSHAIPQSLTGEELAMVLAAPPRYRDRLLLALMGLNGLRVGGALGLRHADLSLRRQELRVVPRSDNANGARAKRWNVLTVPLHPMVADLYADYLEYEYGELDCDYVFVNLWGGQVGQPLSYDSVRSLIAKTTHATGIGFTAHTLRHTFATTLRRGGAPMEVVSELLGHSSVTTTRQTYVHTTVEDLRERLSHVEGWSGIHA
jgi:integrase